MEVISGHAGTSTARANEEWNEKLLKWPALKEDMTDFGTKVFRDGRENRLLEFIKAHPDYEKMSNDPERVLEAMDEFAGQHELLPNLGSDKGSIVADLILEIKPEVLVELGGYLGYSAILFARLLQKHASWAPSAHVWSLEYEPRFAKIADELVSLAGLSDFVTIVTGPADESLRRLKREGKIDHIDFLFIDHLKDLYVPDLKVAMEELALLRRNAHIVADNIVSPGAPEYREYVRSHQSLTSRGVKGFLMPGEVEDELEVSRVL